MSVEPAFSSTFISKPFDISDSSRPASNESLRTPDCGCWPPAPPQRTEPTERVTAPLSRSVTSRPSHRLSRECLRASRPLGPSLVQKRS
jgi:hypothetical protein